MRLIAIGALAGDLLAAAVFAMGDHVAHRQDALGLPGEIMLMVALAVLGGLIGLAAARR